MKKLMTIALIASMAIISGCGNMDIIDWHWRFDKARIKVNDNEWQEVKIKNWHDYDNSDMIAIETDTQVFVTHSVNVILIKTK